MLRLLRSPGASRSPEAHASGEPADPLLALATQAARGERSAQRSLLVALGPGLLRVVRGILGVGHPDVEDVLQQAMMAVHEALPGFRAESSVQHFAGRVALQTAMNARRRAGYRARLTPSVAPDELAELARSDESPAERLASSRRRDLLRQLLEELPAVQAEVLALHVMLGYSVEETAAVVRVPANTIRSRLRSALAALRVRVRDDEGLFESVEAGS